MQDTELYRHLLGIVAPWTVTEVKLDVKKRRVDVAVAREPGTKLQCPSCDRELPTYDHAEERSWRHLDSCQFQTFLRARPPRVDCPEHGVKQVRLPWAEPGSRFTLLFERFAIDVLRETSISGAMAILKIGWETAWNILQRAVDRGQARKQAEPLRVLGLDEKAFARRHRYVTIVCSLEKGTVEHVFEGRTASPLNTWFESLGEERRGEIQAVAMDMWAPYRQAAERWIPQASRKVVYDRFHVMGHVTKAVDLVRRQEHRVLRAEDDNTLARTKYLWLRSQENVSETQRPLLDFLKTSGLRTARAWALKETLREFWNSPTRAAGEAFWKGWWSWAARCRLEPMRKAAWTIKRHLDGVLAYFDHRVTNAAAEGINSKIETVKKRANGFRKLEHFVTAIYFHCGGLELYPAGTH